jgi:uncharacterized protein
LEIWHYVESASSFWKEMDMQQKKCWKRLLKIFAGLVLSAFITLNAIAYMHVHAMTHFVDGGHRTSNPEALGYLNKIKILFTGVTVPRPVNLETPKGYDMPFETLALTNKRGLRLEAWLTTCANAKGTVILFHGYAAGKDSQLPAAAQFDTLEYETLLVDFYGSGGSQGNETSIGYHEADDVLAAFQFARRRSPRQPIILFGTSMGAAAVLAAIHRYNIDPDALILECPFDRMLSTVQNRFRIMQVPSFPSAQLLILWGGIHLGFNGFNYNPADYMREVRCPVLLMHGEKDRYVTLTQMNRLAQNLNPSSRCKIFAGLEHQSYVSAQPEEWSRCVAEFLLRFSRAGRSNIFVPVIEN